MKSLVNALFNLFKTRYVEDWEIEEIAIKCINEEKRNRGLTNSCRISDCLLLQSDLKCEVHCQRQGMDGGIN